MGSILETYTELRFIFHSERQTILSLDFWNDQNLFSSLSRVDLRKDKKLRYLENVSLKLVGECRMNAFSPSELSQLRTESINLSDTLSV